VQGGGGGLGGEQRGVDPTALLFHLVQHFDQRVLETAVERPLLARLDLRPQRLGEREERGCPPRRRLRHLAHRLGRERGACLAARGGRHERRGGGPPGNAGPARPGGGGDTDRPRRAPVGGERRGGG